MEANKELEIKLVKSTDKQETFEIYDAKENLVFKVLAEGHLVPDFYKPEELVLDPDSMLIEHVETKKKVKLSKNQEIDIECLLYDLKEPVNGSLIGHSIKTVTDLFGFDRVLTTISVESSYECECCGTISSYGIEMRNMTTNTKVDFYYDDHFGSGYMPTFYDVMNFILNGSCQEDYVD